MTKRTTKRVVAISDLHCGHRAGLTPTGWQDHPLPGATRKRVKLAAAAHEAWKWYAATIRSLQPIHLLIVNGDCIDGRGEISGGTELCQTDRNEQCAMATAAIELADARYCHFTYGTAYHTGKLEDFEDNIAAAFGAPIGAHEWADVNGCMFDFKHHIGSSGIPHGRKTAIERETLWNRLWAHEKYQPEADVLIRAHVHYAGGSWDVWGGRMRHRLTTPALQTMGSKFGARRCSGLVDFGITEFQVESDGFTFPRVHPAPLESHVARASQY